jgi:hypothetical protein
MLTPIRSEMEQTPDLVNKARHFRTVLAGFKRNLDLLYAGQPTKPQVDSVAVAKAFANWRQGFDAARHLANVNRSDFVVYSAGSMVKELLLAKPLSVAEGLSFPDNVGQERWPEGYAYVSFCLSVAAAVLQNSGEGGLVNEKLSNDAAFWDSFRENASEDASSALGFFDLICGHEPNWEAPDVPWLRPAMRHAAPAVAHKAPNLI